MILRKSRLLQLLFTLLLMTVLLPILFNLFVNHVHSSNSVPNSSHQSSSLSSPSSFEHRSPNNPELEQSFANLLASSGGLANLSILLRSSQSYINAVAGSSLDAQLAYRFADLNNRVKHAEMIANERRHEIFQLLKEIRLLSAYIDTRCKNGEKNFNASERYNSTHKLADMSNTSSSLHKGNYVSYRLVCLLTNSTVNQL